MARMSSCRHRQPAAPGIQHEMGERGKNACVCCTAVGPYEAREEGRTQALERMCNDVKRMLAEVPAITHVRRLLLVLVFRFSTLFGPQGPLCRGDAPGRQEPQIRSILALPCLRAHLDLVA
jgi:hypothetical protein